MTKLTWTAEQIEICARNIVDQEWQVVEIVALVTAVRDDYAAVLCELEAELVSLRQWQRIEFPGDSKSMRLLGELIMSFDLTGEHGPYALCRRVTP